MTIQANVSEQDDIDNATALANAISILTLVTGEPWNKMKLLETNVALKSVARKALTTQGFTENEARSVVSERWNEYEDIETEIPEPQQKAFRTTVLGMTEPAPEPEDTSWMDPGVPPTAEERAERASSKVAEWRKREETGGLSPSGPDEQI